MILAATGRRAMIGRVVEFLILSGGLIVLVALLARRGADRLTKPWLLGALMGLGAEIGVMIEMMPFTSVHAGFTLRTVLAAMIGVFAMRLVGRGIRGWAGGYRDEDRGAARAHARLVHPLIAVGIALSGVLVLHEACAARHLQLEIENTPRDHATGIIKGAEPIRLEGDPAAPAVLLLHGYLGSPADLGALPEALHAAGLTVVAPLLPGHGTTPRDLAAAHPDAWREAALAAYDELAADHDTVHVCGFSAGGWLTLEIAAVRDVGEVVLVNPFLGVTWTPAWLPVSTDTLAEFVAPLVANVMRDDFMVRLADRSQVAATRGYRSVPVRTTVELRDTVASSLEGGLLRKVDERLFVLLSEHDHTVPVEVTRAALTPLADRVEVRTFDRSDHILLLDFDRDAAVRAIVERLR